MKELNQDNALCALSSECVSKQSYLNTVEKLKKITVTHLGLTQTKETLDVLDFAGH